MKQCFYPFFKHHICEIALKNEAINLLVPFVSLNNIWNPLLLMIKIGHEFHSGNHITIILETSYCRFANEHGLILSYILKLSLVTLNSTA